VETTVLEEGFMAAWESASKLISKHRGETEFLPVREQRDRYPPLPLQAMNLDVFEPPEEEVEEAFRGSIGAMENTLYGASLDLLEDRLRGARGIAAARLRNRMGVLHARFGRDREAESAFSRCLAEEPAFTPAYLNLANLKLLRGELEEAAETARAGLQRDPDSALLNVFLALYHNRRGEPERASIYLDRVRSSSPELAGRYSYLGETSVRARAGAVRELTLIWDSGE
jgi:tetratricopeptide (TPR) repeat protein